MPINTFPDDEILRIVDSVRRVEATAQRLDSLVAIANGNRHGGEIKRLEIGETKPESASYPAPGTSTTFLIRLKHIRHDEQEANNTLNVQDRAKEIWAWSCVGYVPEATLVLCGKVGRQWFILNTVQCPTPTLAIAPAGGIPGVTGSAPPFTPGSAICELAARVGSVVNPTGESATVWNSAGEVAGNALLQCKVINCDLWVDVENCPAQPALEFGPVQSGSP